MISIIVATYRPELLKNLEKSIQETIGVRYEMISIDNSNKKGICEIYNSGVQKAKYDIICFIHEDVIMKTHNWGVIVKNIFHLNPGIGLVGVAGGSYKTAIPTHWSFEGANPQTIHMSIIQHDKSNVYANIINPTNVSLAKVVSIDGVWMCTLKGVLKENKFDDILLKGFHGYDVDFSLSVFQKFDVVVTFDIMLEHLSNGSFDKKWINETINLHKKWEHLLPINTVANLTYEQQREEEIKALNIVYHKMVNNKFTGNNFNKLILKPKLINLIGMNNILKIIIKLSLIKLGSIMKTFPNM